MEIYKTAFYVNAGIFTFLFLAQDKPEQLDMTTTTMTNTSLKPDS